MLALRSFDHVDQVFGMEQHIGEVGFVDGVLQKLGVLQHFVGFLPQTNTEPELIWSRIEVDQYMTEVHQCLGRESSRRERISRSGGRNSPLWRTRDDHPLEIRWKVGMIGRGKCQRARGTGCAGQRRIQCSHEQRALRAAQPGAVHRIAREGWKIVDAEQHTVVAQRIIAPREQTARLHADGGGRRRCDSGFCWSGDSRFDVTYPLEGWRRRRRGRGWRWSGRGWTRGYWRRRAPNCAERDCATQQDRTNVRW